MQTQLGQSSLHELVFQIELGPEYYFLCQHVSFRRKTCSAFANAFASVSLVIHDVQHVKIFIFGINVDHNINQNVKLFSPFISFEGQMWTQNNIKIPQDNRYMCFHKLESIMEAMFLFLFQLYKLFKESKYQTLFKESQYQT